MTEEERLNLMIYGKSHPEMIITDPNHGNMKLDPSDEVLKELERLRKYEQLVQYIASDYWELSYDKIRWLYTEYKTKCRELIKEDNIE